MPDHYMWGEGRGGNSTLETWTVLTYLAAKTEQIHRGTVVTPIPFRPPAMLAKELSTLDLISNGRVVLGVGAGWSQTEFEGYSKWDDAKVRVDKTAEGLELILKLWTSKEPVDFKGKFYEAIGAALDPKPVQKPYPLLLFGGASKRMIRMAGKYADICLVPPWTASGIDKSKEIVKEAARKNSRENKIAYASIFFSREGYNEVQVMKKVSASKDRGDDYFIMGFPRDRYIETMNQFAKNIMPSF